MREREREREREMKEKEKDNMIISSRGLGREDVSICSLKSGERKELLLVWLVSCIQAIVIQIKLQRDDLAKRKGESVGEREREKEEREWEESWQTALDLPFVKRLLQLIFGSLRFLSTTDDHSAYIRYLINSLDFTDIEPLLYPILVPISSDSCVGTCDHILSLSRTSMITAQAMTSIETQEPSTRFLLDYGVGLIMYISINRPSQSSFSPSHFSPSLSSSPLHSSLSPSSLPLPPSVTKSDTTPTQPTSHSHTLIKPVQDDNNTENKTYTTPIKSTNSNCKTDSQSLTTSQIESLSKTRRNYLINFLRRRLSTCVFVSNPILSKAGTTSSSSLSELMLDDGEGCMHGYMFNHFIEEIRLAVKLQRKN
mmetsp:Transcript_30967/g.31518  ORF Transcript_30967/g.31518 Transcript_30967/m.31518 type:complete len:368 (+) Transcript_30967:790-1893(+)